MCLNKGVFARYPSEVTSFLGKAACYKHSMALMNRRRLFIEWQEYMPP